MERIRVLIDKLIQQQEASAAPAQLLVTVQLLQNELMQLQQNQQTTSRSKVAVILPVSAAAAAPVRQQPTVPLPEAAPVVSEVPPKVTEVAPQITEKAPAVTEDWQPMPAQAVASTADCFTNAAPPQPEVPQNMPLPEPQPAFQQPAPAPFREEPKREVPQELRRESYTLRKPSLNELFEERKGEAQPAMYQPPAPEAPSPYMPPMWQEPEPAPTSFIYHEVPEEVQPEPLFTEPPRPAQAHLPFDPIVEAPTLSQHKKEVHELIADKKESLNDRLKQDKTELGHFLKDTPIKDLRKAIGVNDKFLFINELFRGDEAMYERSIKTINSFHIFPEAEYWINRELKVKLGWIDSKDTVQHFYNLVRRRFS